MLIPLSAPFASFMVLRFKMLQDALFITGGLQVLIILILICLRLGFAFWDICQLMLLLISFFLVVTFLIHTLTPPTSSAAPPACLDGFIVETNGGTGGAYTCTPPH